MNFLLGIGLYIVNNAPALVGFILPPIVQILNKDVQNEVERFWITVLVCVGAAVALHWNQLLSGDAKQVAGWIAIVFTESQIVYRLYFKYSIISQKISTMFTPVQPEVGGE